MRWSLKLKIFTTVCFYPRIFSVQNRWIIRTRRPIMAGITCLAAKCVLLRVICVLLLWTFSRKLPSPSRLHWILASGYGSQQRYLWFPPESEFCFWEWSTNHCGCGPSRLWDNTMRATRTMEEEGSHKTNIHPDLTQPLVTYFRPIWSNLLYKLPYMKLSKRLWVLLGHLGQGWIVHKAFNVNLSCNFLFHEDLTILFDEVTIHTLSHLKSITFKSSLY